MIFTFAYAYKCEFLTVLVFKYSVKMDVLNLTSTYFLTLLNLKLDIVFQYICFHKSGCHFIRLIVIALVKCDCVQVALL